VKFVIVMFGGGWGRQFAAVVSDDGGSAASVRVRKWRRQGKCWTKPVWVPRSQIVNPRATAAMAKRFKADLGAL
jgi:hypothetical protein